MRRIIGSFVAGIALLAGVIAAPGLAAAAPVSPLIDVEACSANSLAANDDASAAAITLPFELQFYTRS